MTPEERIKYLEELTSQTKKDLVEREKVLKESQELLERNRHDMLQQALLQEQKLLKEQEERKKLDDQRTELSKYLEKSKDLEKQGKDLEANVQNTRLPQGHPIVGLYTQLQQMKYNYQQQDAEIDYARTIVIEDLRKEVVEVLRQYKEITEEVKELADATYKLTKELLGDTATANTKKYLP